MNKPKNNTELTQFIEHCYQRMPGITDKVELEELFDDCEKFPYQISYNLTFYIVGLIIALAILILGFTPELVFIIPTVGSVIVIAYLLIDKIRKVKNLNEDIKNLAMRVLYKGRNMSDNELNECFSAFHDFYRHNHTNGLTSGLEIDCNTQLNTMRVKVVMYHGVQETEYKDKDGKTRYKYVHYYRQGVIFPVGTYTSTIIYRNKLINKGEIGRIKAYKESFYPASNTFKKMFNVKGLSEFEMAKLLVPTVVEYIEQAGSDLKDLTIEFDQEGNMLICQKDSNLLKLKTTYNLQNPQQLKDELLNKSYEKLDYILGFATKIINHIQ